MSDSQQLEIRDRIRELRRVKASQLLPHPQNWRIHPERQRRAMQSVLREIGYADALLARELADGSLELIDGHLRAETTPNQLVPVLILDVDEREARAILATHDPLANLAEVDAAELDRLVKQLDFSDPDIAGLLESVTGAQPAADFEQQQAADQSDQLVEKYQLLITCADETQQCTLLARFTDEGLSCRALIS